MLKNKLTPIEICDIKVACVKMFVDTASRLDIKDDIRILQKAKLVFDFVMETTDEDCMELPKGSK